MRLKTNCITDISLSDNWMPIFAAPAGAVRRAIYSVDSEFNLLRFAARTSVR